tara:strand:- start:472 stop:1017 length:546 start_codon:yes stop_codon:yes gene_type:complete
MKNCKFKIPEDLLKYLRLHGHVVAKRADETADENSEGYSVGVYADDVFETLLLNMQPTFEELSGVKLIPTYSYFRRYYKGSGLFKHLDRESCEYSVTISLNSAEPETPWEIFIDEKPFKLEIGEGVIYKGMEQEHYRKSCPVKYSDHVFLHYVNANGNCKNFAYDLRKSLHTLSTTNIGDV